MSSSTDVWETIASEAAVQSPLWNDSLRERPEREAIFSTVAPPRFALGLETIYEGYLLHYGRPRLFEPEDEEAALLLGDYLYAHGLVRIAALGEVDAVSALAELISACAHLRGEGEDGDGETWLGTARRLGGDPEPATAERALAAHAARMG